MLYLIYLLIAVSIFLLMLAFFLRPTATATALPVLAEIDETQWIPAKRPLIFKLFRFLLPLNRIIANRIGRTKLDNNAMAAGLRVLPEEFLLIKEGFFVLSIFVCIFIAGKVDIIALALTLFIANLFFELWLKLRKNKRKKLIIRTLPDVIDLLSLCVNAGLDFGTAMKWIVDKSRSNPMIEELKLVLFEIGIGKTRRQALQDMAKRIKLSEVNSFSRSIIQAERLGTPIETALNILSDDIRDYTFRRRERQALQAPIKMLFPLVFFIMPVVVIIVGGPILLQFMKGGLPTFK